MSNYANPKSVMSGDHSNIEPNRTFDDADRATQDLREALSRIADLDLRECLERNLGELGYIR